MQKFVKLFVLAMCLTFVGALWANSAKGPVANYTSKYGTSWIENTDGATKRSPASDRRRALDEVIIDENFDAVTADSLPAGWIFRDVDGAFCGQFARNSTWRVFNYTTNARSQPNVLMNHYNDGAVPNNDWVILPQQTLTGEIILSFWAATQQAIYPETFAVKVSTTGTQPANFTTTIATHANIPAAWTEYTFDLSQFAGSPFYVAIHHTSVDQFVIKVDDLLLTAGEAGPTGFVAGLVLDDVSGLPLPGVAVSGGGGTATTDAQGNYLMVANVGTHNVTFTLDGYDTYVAAGVVVAEADTTQVDVLLTPTAATNDDCDTPTVLTLGNTDYSTVDATLDPTTAALPATCDEGFGVDFGADIWFAFTSPGDGDVRLSTCGQANYDTRLAVYYAGGTEVPGCPTTNADFYACNDDGTGCSGFTSLLDMEVVGGHVYLVRVGGFGAANGTGTLSVTFSGVSVDDAPGTVPSSFAFHGAFPNPFNPTTQLRFDVPATSDVTLKVYNSIGQEVATLVDGLTNAGSHTAEFSAASLPSGLYFAQLRSGSFVSTQKLVLMK